MSSPAYGVICLSNFLFFMVLGVPFTFGPDLLLKRGLCSPDLSSYMITCIGLANMAGQIGVGGFADLPWVDSSVVTGVAMVVSGASVAVLPVCATYVQACQALFCCPSLWFVYWAYTSKVKLYVAESFLQW